MPVLLTLVFEDGSRKREVIYPTLKLERLYVDVRNISELLDGLGRIHRDNVGGWLSTSGRRAFLVGALDARFWSVPGDFSFAQCVGVGIYSIC